MHPAVFLALLSACGSNPDAPGRPSHRPVLAVLATPGERTAAEARRAVQGARLALGKGWEVSLLDKGEADSALLFSSSPPEALVVLGPGRDTLELGERVLRETRIPVVLAGAGEAEGMPRVVPSTDTHLKCATRILAGHKVDVVSDATPEARELAEALKSRLGGALHASTVLDPSALANEARRVGRMNGTILVYIGATGTGGDLLRLLRKDDPAMPFLGMGLYDLGFLDAAGAAAEGAHVTSLDLPLISEEISASYKASFQEPPSSAAANTHAAATLLRAAVQAARRSGDDPRAHLLGLEITATSGLLRLLPDGTPDPAWCTEFSVADHAFHAYGLLRVTNGEVEIVEGQRKLDDEQRTRHWGEFLSSPDGVLPDPNRMPRQILTVPDRPIEP